MTIKERTSTQEIISIIELAISKEAIAVDEYIQHTGMTKSYYSNFKNGHRDFNLDSLTKYLIALKTAVKNELIVDGAVNKITDTFFGTVIDESLLHIYKNKFKKLLNDKMNGASKFGHSSTVSMLRSEGVSSDELVRVRDLVTRILDDLKGYL